MHRYRLPGVEHREVDGALKRDTSYRRERVCATLRGREFSVCERQVITRCRRRLPGHDDLVRALDRKRTQRDAVKHTECRRGSANANSQRTDCDRREHWIATECAQRKPDVEPHVLDHAQPRRGPFCLGVLCYATKSRNRAPPRFIGSVVGTHILLRFHLEVQADFFRQPLVLCVAFEVLPHASSGAIDPAHALCITTSRAATGPSRRQSAASWLFPCQARVAPAS